jgi:CubicO group peptidase (beta-lactamase class C family)
VEPWLSAALTYLPPWLEFQLRQYQQPGCTVAIVHQGEVIFELALGTAELGSGEALTPRHRFRVGSHSKTFTAAGLMVLRERGRISLDDPIACYLSGLHPVVSQVTVAQVLMHSAGLTRDGTAGGQFDDWRPFADREEVLANLAAPSPLEPNTRFKYSNHGYALLGLIIEAITGEPYGTWITREVIEAFGLTETLPDAPPLRDTPFARGHTGRQPLGERLIVPGDLTTRAIAPAGGFVSTASDLARFFAQISPHSGPGPLPVAARREMIRRQWRNPHAALSEGWYGLGTASGSLVGWDWFGHSGGVQGYASRTAVVPERDLTVCVLTNATDGWSWMWVDGLLHVLRTFARHGAPADGVQGWSGRWWTTWGATDLVPAGQRVLLATPALFNPFLDASEAEITNPTEGHIVLANGYASHGEPVRLIRDARGDPKEFWIAGTRYIQEAALATEMRERYRHP